MGEMGLIPKGTELRIQSSAVPEFALNIESFFRQES